jgi:endonuclease YncB( thermonuclease family)
LGHVAIAFERCGFLLGVLALLALLAPGSAAASTATVLRAHGQAVAFDDGDSFDLRLSARRTVTIRLHAIDAPERVQAHGEAARRALDQAISGRPVRVDCYKRDARGRYVCRAWAGSDDLQLQMLRHGHAWHLMMYLDEQSSAERGQYARAQAQARAARHGLWAQPQPMPPWVCRTQLRRLRPCR